MKQKLRIKTKSTDFKDYKDWLRIDSSGHFRE